MPGLNNPVLMSTIDYATPTDPTSAVQGQISANANKVTATLKAAAPTGQNTPPAVDPAIDPKVVDPKEVVFCDESGALVYAVALISGFYTKE